MSNNESIYDQLLNQSSSRASKPETRRQHAIAPPYEAYSHIQQRIHAYRNGNLRHKIGPMRMTEIERLDALKHDPTLAGYSPLIEVQEIGPRIDTSQEHQSASAYFAKQPVIPNEWRNYIETGHHAPHNLDRTSFIHQFDKANTTAIIYDVYRPPWKPYYATDAFLSQWAEAHQFANGAEQAAKFHPNQLPKSFPKNLYINNITHKKTHARIHRLLDRADTDSLTLRCAGKAYSYLSDTPHVKYVSRIFLAYNSINDNRGELPFKPHEVLVFRRNNICHLKFRCLHP